MSRDRVTRKDTDNKGLSQQLMSKIIVKKGKLYFMGGYDGTQVVNTVLEYDPASPGWTPKTPMPVALHEHACAVWNGKIYVVGGSTTWASPSANSVPSSWSPA